MTTSIDEVTDECTTVLDIVAGSSSEDLSITEPPTGAPVARRNRTLIKPHYRRPQEHSAVTTRLPRQRIQAELCGTPENLKVGMPASARGTEA